MDMKDNSNKNKMDTSVKPNMSASTRKKSNNLMTDSPSMDESISIVNE